MVDSTKKVPSKKTDKIWASSWSTSWKKKSTKVSTKKNTELKKVASPRKIKNNEKLLNDTLHSSDDANTMVFAFSFFLIVISVIAGFLYAREVPLPAPPIPVLQTPSTTTVIQKFHPVFAMTLEIENALNSFMNNDVSIDVDDILMNTTIIDSSNTEFNFSQKSQVGDIVFEFTRDIYLYRPSSDSIIWKITKSV